MKATRSVFFLLLCAAVWVPMAKSDLVSDDEQQQFTSAMHAGALVYPTAQRKTYCTPKHLDILSQQLAI